LAKQDPTAARRLLVARVRHLATGIGLAIRTARALNLPVEPGVPLVMGVAQRMGGLGVGTVG
jgi:hypothetical protein